MGGTEGAAGPLAVRIKPDMVHLERPHPRAYVSLSQERPGAGRRQSGDFNGLRRVPTQTDAPMFGGLSAIGGKRRGGGRCPPSARRWVLCEKETDTDCCDK